MGFEMFPPEVNSALMYAGPGPGSMVSAAAAWDGLAADLYASAQSYQSVLSGLSAGWQGPSAVAMTVAAAPYTAWMNSTASLAEQAGAQLKAAVAAYEAAYMATVAPPVIAANRATLALLVATNFFGQNFPAIAATEAHYMEMWAQDGLAMNTYAASSAQLTSTLAPFDAPAATANPITAAEAALPAAVSSAGASVLSFLSGLTTTFPAMLSGLTSASPLAGISGLLSGTGLSGLLSVTPLGGLISGGLTPALTAEAINMASVPTYLVSYMGLSGMKMLVSMGSSLGANSSGMDMTVLANNINTMVNAKLQPAVRGLATQFTSMSRGVLANFGKANAIGGLSVPEGWSPTGSATLTRAIPGVLPETAVASPALNAPSPAMSNPFTQALMSTLSGRGMGGAQPNTRGGIKGVTRVPAGG